MRKKKHILTILFIAILLNGFAGDVNPRTFDYSTADSIALNCNQKFKETSDLAHALTKDLNTDHEKFRSIFRWVTNNIAYSYSARKVEPKYVLKKRKAICSGYSNLLQDLCSHVMLECEVVSGYAKSLNSSIGKLKETNHAWNAIRLDGDWYLVDATWAAGYVERRKFTRDFEDFYFLANPEEFMYRHFPENPEWFLTDEPIRKKTFEKIPVRAERFFTYGLKDIEEPKGEVKNKLKYVFTSEEPVRRMSMRFERDKEFTKLDFEENEGVYSIDVNLKNRPTGFFYIYVNGGQVLTFKRK